LKWTAGFVKPNTPASANPIPAAIVHHTALAHDLVHKAQACCKKLLGDGEGELLMMRLHSRTAEYILVPGESESLLVVQKANSAALLPLVKLAEAEQLAKISEKKAPEAAAGGKKK
jgi:hypothetical protein